ncbi:MAG: hypothetical protein WC876_09280 [Candidatus Thermoplasmatota archaeon]|jgi:hypothetical protein
MTSREWALPIALGLLVAAGLWALPEKQPEPVFDPETGEPTTPVLTFPFEVSRGAEGAETTFIVLAPEGRAAAEQHLNATGLNWTAADLDWVNAGLALFSPQNVLTGCHVQANNVTLCSDPWWAFRPWSLPRALAVPDAELGPRLGSDGYNATRATIYVFDERGLLAATNDAEGNWSRFAGAPTTMQPAVWYIGANATAPNGTEPLPSFAVPLVQKLRPLMEGLPVGGVATTQSNAYVNFYGTLFITARIDALVYAP